MFTDDKAKEWLHSLLEEGEVTVKFTKKDGSERVMKCTLNQNMIPTEKMPKGTGKQKSDNTISVFDLDVDGWRSFCYDSVKEINLSIN